MKFIQKDIQWNDQQRTIKLPDPSESIEKEWAESDYLESHFPYWRSEWYSVYALHDVLCGWDIQTDDIQLELGSGCGILAQIYTSRQGHWIFSDLIGDSLKFMKNQIKLGPNDFILQGSWDNLFCREMDLIVASDVLYEQSFIGPLIDFAQRGLKVGGHFIIADPSRSGRESALDELINGWRGPSQIQKSVIRMNSLNIEIDVAILQKDE